MVEDVLGRNATAGEIEAALNKICDLLPAAAMKKCKAAVVNFVKAIDKDEVAFLLKYSPFAGCAIMEVCQIDCCGTPYTPEQIHLSLTGNPTEMAVTWVTLQDTPAGSFVHYGRAPNARIATVNATSSTYTNGGWKGVVHKAVMVGLVPGETYYYEVGTPTPTFWNKPNLSQEPTLHFRAAPTHGTSPVRVAVVGDMGATDISDRTLHYLSLLAEQRAFDFLQHSGDISYADGYEALWDFMLRKMETIAAYFPLQATVGNHVRRRARSGGRVASVPQ